MPETFFKPDSLRSRFWTGWRETGDADAHPTKLVFTKAVSFPKKKYIPTGRWKSYLRILIIIVRYRESDYLGIYSRWLDRWDSQFLGWTPRYSIQVDQGELSQMGSQWVFSQKYGLETVFWKWSHWNVLNEKWISCSTY